MEIDLRLGDCLEVMQEMEPESIDTVITDPPYGLGEQPDIIPLLEAWIKQESYEGNSGGGFMGKEWDAIVPGPKYWKEVYRVMKPGAILLAFGGTRTVDLLTIALRLASFEIRDQIEWIYGSGMNKGGYISLSMERRLTYVGKDHKRYYESDDKPMKKEPPFRYPGADKWWGWAPSLKPAHEPIVVCQKPINDTYIENALDVGVAGLWIDGGRISVDPAVDKKDFRIINRNEREDSGGQKWGMNKNKKDRPQVLKKKGRWPANLILSHDPRCKKVGQKKIKGRQINRWKDGAKPFGDGAGHEFESEKMEDDVVEVYDCYEGCPIRIMNEQSGVSISSGGQINKKDGGDVYAGGWGGDWEKGDPGYGDEGGAARFFYCAKASRSEKDAGLEKLAEKTFGQPGGARQKLKNGEEEYLQKDHIGLNKIKKVRNHHPTCKPIDLMRYLVRLTKTPDGGVVLDPFMGSGTTGIGCVFERRDFIGIEKEPDYMEIAKLRIEHYKKDPEALQIGFEDL